jgi:hypothetical protein
VACRFHELVVDCAEPARLAAFWAAVLGYVDVTSPGETGVEIARAPGSEPSLIFVPVPQSKTLKNRLHIDLRPEGTDQPTELRRLLALGARQVDVGQDPEVSWIVLADPEDNEFCLLRRPAD